MVRTLLASALLLLIAAPTASASELVSGNFVQIWFNDAGTWNVEFDPGDGSDPYYEGFQADLGDGWSEFSGQGTPWAHVVLTYEKSGARSVYVGSPWEDATTWTVLSGTEVSSGANAIMRHGIRAGDLSITKTETWDLDGQAVYIDFELNNVSTADLSDVELLWVVDPDQDWDLSSLPDDGRTVNDTQDLNGDGIDDFASSEGAYSGFTLGVGVCDPAYQEVGHAPPPDDIEDYGYSFADMDGAFSDLLGNWRHVEPVIGGGETVHFRLLVTVASTVSEAEDLYLGNVEGCQTCDSDEDGYESVACGGDDCDDGDANTYPGAEELEDDADNDCDGVDENDDTDGDGLADETEIDIGSDPNDDDTDGDGYKDGVEWGEGDTPVDSDSDGTIDILDTDDDDDGVPTLEERNSDNDADGIDNRLDPDDDGDGIPTLTETSDDFDADGTPNYLDLDSDGDGLEDEVEGTVDTDSDGAMDFLDLDSDGDARPDADEGKRDKDCDEIVNYLDADDMDGPCQVKIGDFQGGGGATCSSSGDRGDLSWLALALAAPLLRRRQRR